MTFWQFAKTRLFWLHVFTATLTVALFTVICVFLMDSYTLHDSSVKVPDFKGLYAKDLDKFVEDYSVSYKIIDSTSTGEEAKGTIVKQEPDAGSIVKEGRVIYLTVKAMQNEQVKMPNLEGLPIKMASEELEAFGLKPGRRIPVESSEIIVRGSESPVIRQLYKNKEIKPGTLIDKGAAIDMEYIKNAEGDLILVPNLSGMTVPEARVELQALGLSIGSVFPDNSMVDSLQAKIYRQYPESDDEGLYKGAKVNIWISENEDMLER
ncbi:MAG: PASTA domain-containing protein [Bacteroidia bacterium]|jgi:beta-lactam-binding protein with PASTA domain